MGFMGGKWPFYVSGILIALLIAASLYLFDDTLGMNEGMIMISDYCREVIDSPRLPELEPEPDNWQLGFLGGIFIGALAASLFSGKWRIKFFSSQEGNFFTSAFKSLLLGLGGGFLVMLGLQISGDSFFGQVAAAVQLSAGAWIFLIICLVVATLTAILLERRHSKAGGGD